MVSPLRESPDEADDFALDAKSFWIDWVHLGIGGFEDDLSSFVIKPFQCREVVIDKCDNYFAVFCLINTFYNNIIAVKNSVFNH